MELIDFLEPHSVCLSIEPVLVWLLVVFDAGIAISYLIISLGLMQLMVAAKRKSLLISMFSVFILFCGLSHLASVVTMYFGGWAYLFQVFACGATFIVSFVTCIVLLMQGKEILNKILPHLNQ